MAPTLRSLVLAGWMALAPAVAAAADGALTVVELFTSQGCDSCPPADALLAQLAEREDVLALSVHVDYWDYIGWKDPFASPAHTQRQRDYAQRFGRRYVYTPQMVIHGTVEVVGSDRDAVLAGIARAQAQAPVAVVLRRAGKGAVALSIAKTPVGEEAAVWMVVYDREHVTAVSRGENEGRTLRNRNVVREMREIATWRGEALELAIPVAAAADGSQDCAVILQSRTTGRILGSAKLPPDRAG